MFDSFAVVMITNYHRQQETFSLWRVRWRLHRGEKMLKGKMQQNPSETWDLIFRVVLQRTGTQLHRERERERSEGKTDTENTDHCLETDTGRLRVQRTRAAFLFSLHALAAFFTPPPCTKRAHTGATAAFSPSAWSFSKRNKVVSEFFCRIWRYVIILQNVC